MKNLTAREKQCLELAAEGLVTKEIARHLCLGFNTVKSHLQTARRKLGAPNTTNAVVRALAVDLIEYRCNGS